MRRHTRSSSSAPALAGAAAVAVALALVLAQSALANHSITERVSIGQINGNGAAGAAYAGSSADGSRAFFDSTEQLASGDTDGSLDLYERSGGTTARVSAGQINGNGANDAFFAGASEDGSRVFFHTREQLVSADTDTRFDIYERSSGTTTRISAGQINGNGALDALLVGKSTDGTRIFFETNEQLVSADTDSMPDVYERSGVTTSLVSTGPTSAVGSFFARFKGASTDGARVFFESDDKLVATDTDSQADVYERSGGTTTTLLSTGPSGGNGPLPAGFDGASSDGTRVFLHTDEQLTSGDTDSQRDIYERFSGSTTQVSAGQINGNGAFPVTFNHASSDGSRVVFESFEQLATGDTDTAQDVYERAGGTTTRISAGQINGNGALNDVFYDGASSDGTRVLFETDEQLTSGDGDSAFDIYERSGGTTTTLLSRSATAGNAAVDVFYDGASSDATRMFFHTTEQLLGSDTDSQADAYERAGGLVTRLSRGPAGGNAALPASFGGATPDGAFAYIHTAEALAAGDTDSAQDVYSITPFDGPQAATPLTVALVPNFRQTISTSQCTARGGLNSSHGLPDLPGGTNPDGSCNPPAFTPGTVAHFGTQASGSVVLTTAPGDFTTVTDEADVTVAVSATDVRGGSATGADYNPVAAGPDLTFQARIRISDTLNTGAQQQPATLIDQVFGVPVGCTTTASPSIGSSCSASSSLDAAIPAMGLTEGMGTVLQVFRVRLTDSGNNGARGDGDDRDFAQQGIYVP